LTELENKTVKDKKQYKIRKTKNIFLCLFFYLSNSIMITVIYSGYYDYERDVNPFIVDSNFYYLTACDVPNLTIIEKNNKTYALIDLPKDFFYDVTHIQEQIQEALDCEVLDSSALDSILQGANEIHTFPNIESHPQYRVFERHHLNTAALTQEVAYQREIKLKDELYAIETACKYTSHGLKHIMKLAKVGMNLREIIGIFKYYLSRNGIQELSFNPIASHGKDNSILHYEAADKQLTHDNLVLVDLGCRYKHYCSDITRTFPLSGKFSDKGKELYQIVLHSLKYALSLLKPNADWEEITYLVRLELFNLCHKAGIFKDISEPKQQLEASSALMPHSLGHHVGLDNHDGGPITILQRNMVIAVEPGIYFNPLEQDNPYFNKKVWKQYERLGGVRIEDTVIITSTGHKNLSKVTKEISGIEKLMK